MYFSPSDQISTLQEELRTAQNAKAEAELLANNSDSVDKTVIEALRQEGKEQKQTVITTEKPEIIILPLKLVLINLGSTERNCAIHSNHISVHVIYSVVQIADFSQEVAELSSKFLAKEQEVSALSLQLAQSNSKVINEFNPYICNGALILSVFVFIFP